MYKVYVSMAYVCHRNDFEMYFNVFKKDVMPPSTTGGYYGRFNIEPYYGDCCWELSRGKWGPCKPHLTTGCALGMYIKMEFPDIWIFIFKSNIIFKSSSLHKACFVRIVECHWALAHFV